MASSITSLKSVRQQKLERRSLKTAAVIIKIAGAVVQQQLKSPRRAF